ncbi:MAG: ATP-binding protein [Pseudomonadota bacterium]
MPPNEQMDLIDRALELLAESPNADPALLGDAYIGRIQATQLLGRLDEAEQAARDGLKLVNLEDQPDQYLRLVTAPALLDYFRGKPEAAKAALDQILTQDFSAADPKVFDGVRSNYATVLQEIGETLRAIEIYQEVLRRALDRSDESMAMILANNLIVILILQGLHEDARNWLNQIADLRARSQIPWARESLLLHDLELQRIFGDAEGSAAGLRQFIAATGEETAITNVGNAYEFLAEALIVTGDFAGAEDAARMAIDKLTDLPSELAEARLALVRSLFLQGKLAEVPAVLDEIDLDKLSPSRQARVAGLRLEHRLRVAGDRDGVAELLRFLDASGDAENARTVQSVQYYNAKLTAQRQQAEIARIRESEIRLAAEADVSAARASELQAREQVVKKNRNLLLAVVILTAVVLMTLLYTLNRRGYQKRILAREQALNLELTQTVEEKSEALRQQLGEQAELERALDRKKRNELVGQLTSNVAHDFNNLLQVISSANEQFEPLTETPAQRAVLGASNDSIRYASEMIHQLLAYSRQQELQATATDISKLLDGTRTLFRSAVGEEITLTFGDFPANAVALVDPAKLTSAILNLLRNASDAVNEAGAIRVDVSRETLDKQQTRAWPSLEAGDYVLVTVEDNGQGMDSATLERATEPFFTTKSETTGTGLGLSSVHGFVRQSAGDLLLRSSPEDGTRVTLALPASEMAVAPAEPSAVANDSLQGKQVLVVEDNEMVARTVTVALQSVGAQVCCLDSADEALNHLAANREYHYLLTDVRMPGSHNGYDLARWASDHCPAMPIIIMSGFTERTDTSDEFTMISKPFTRAALIEALQQASVRTTAQA